MNKTMTNDGKLVEWLTIAKQNIDVLKNAIIYLTALSLLETGVIIYLLLRG